MSERHFGVEGRNLKRKMVEDVSLTNDEEIELSLSLSVGGHNKMVIGESSTNMAPPFKSLKSSHHHDQVKKPEQHQFSCKFCNKKFLSSQALSGHHNAHRREKALSRNEREIELDTFGHRGPYMCPYSVMPNHRYPFHGPVPYFHGHPMTWPGYGNMPFVGMTNPRAGISQNLYPSSLVGTNRAFMAYGGLGGLPRSHHYAENQQFPTVGRTFHSTFNYRF